jgi:hypothetical protein
MLLAPFTLHKVQKYFSGFGLFGGFHWKLAILRNLDGGYRWLKDTILKSFRPFTLPNEIQLAPDSIMQRTHLVLLQEWYPLQYKGLWLQEPFWMYMYNYIQIFCA